MPISQGTPFYVTEAVLRSKNVTQTWLDNNLDMGKVLVTVHRQVGSYEYECKTAKGDLVILTR